MSQLTTSHRLIALLYIRWEMAGERLLDLAKRSDNLAHIEQCYRDHENALESINWALTASEAHEEKYGAESAIKEFQEYVIDLMDSSDLAALYEYTLNRFGNWPFPLAVQHRLAHRDSDAVSIH